MPERIWRTFSIVKFPELYSTLLDTRVKRAKIRLPVIGERIIINEFVIDDWIALQEIFSQEDISEYVGGSPYRQKGGEPVEDAFARARREDWEPYSIRKKETERAIGFVSIFYYDEDVGSVEMSIGLLSVMQGRGYAYDTSMIAIQEIFASTSAARVVVRVDPCNSASLMLVNKLSMTSIGTRINLWTGSEDLLYAKEKPAPNT